ncbi:MAG: hypothetical protein M3R47_12915 [Chloroflexota bacterium]|nr:hypothetical protein [Chloroflexota bacterium]
MDRTTATRAGLAIIIFVMGSLQAWDSGVPEAGLLIVFLVSLAIALPAVALLVPVEQTYFLGAFALSFILLIVARLISPTSLPGLFIVLVPAVMALIFTGIFRGDAKT